MAAAVDMAWAAGLWGFLGGIVYSAPKFSACLYSAREAKRGWAWCFLEFLVAQIVATISAAVLAPWVIFSFHRSPEHEISALSGIIGLVANRAAPGVIDVLNGRLLKKLKGDTP